MLETKYLKKTVGKIPLIDSKLSTRDRLGAALVRCNIRRMDYTIEKGLYANGSPDTNSPVLVSANYKLSFDLLRKELRDLNAWILVLDTKGINVWCAAGKGTFGTNELISRLDESKLEQVVAHKKLIVPQLGAPGITAHEVQEKTGFHIIYGPVQAKHIREFINNGNKATEEMRTISFNLVDRLKVIPVEFIQGLKYSIVAAIILFLLSGLQNNGYDTENLMQSGLNAAIFIFASLISGAVLTPAFLPFIPGRAFSLKGFVLCIPVFFILSAVLYENIFTINLERIALFLMMTAFSSFFAMNFTGSSTYTSLSGVRNEIRYAMPLQIAGVVIGFIFWLTSRFV